MPRGDGRLSHEIDPQGGPGPQDACGVFGVWAPGEEVAKLTYFGLYVQIFAAIATASHTTNTAATGSTANAARRACR